MIYHLSLALKPFASWVNVLHYVSFRAIAGLLTSLMLSFIFGGWFIEKSRQIFKSKSRQWTPESHKAKDDMPTMGGIFIILTCLMTAYYGAILPIGRSGYAWGLLLALA